MSITGTNVLDRARKVLQDEGTTKRWSDAEALLWINEGILELAKDRPDLAVTTKNLTLVAGTKQAITDIAVIRFIRNMGTGGTTPGTAPTTLRNGVLDGTMPDWHSHAADAVVRFVTYDPRAPKIFWVYPPQPGSSQGQLEVEVAVVPTVLNNLASTVPYDDVYLGALVDYLLARTFAKETDAGSLAKSAGYLASYKSKVGSLPVANGGA